MKKITPHPKISFFISFAHLYYDSAGQTEKRSGLNKGARVSGRAKIYCFLIGQESRRESYLVLAPWPNCYNIAGR